MWSKLTVLGARSRREAGQWTFVASDLTELKAELAVLSPEDRDGRAVSTVTSIPGAKDGSCQLSRWSGAQGGFSPASPPVWPEEGKAHVLNIELHRERCSAEERSRFQQLIRKRSSPHGPQACGKMSSP